MRFDVQPPFEQIDHCGAAFRAQGLGIRYLLEFPISRLMQRAVLKGCPARRQAEALDACSVFVGSQF
jgi:hypothetical protein